MHLSLRSSHSLAMHFATFAGSDTEALEPVVELAQARKDKDIPDWREEGGMGVIDVGEVVDISPLR